MNSPSIPPDPSPAEQREIDRRLAARLGISVEALHEIDRQMAEDVAARDAALAERQVLDSNPKFTKGFGPVTPENEIPPGELEGYYKNKAEGT